jgi:hypothetical protein
LIFPYTELPEATRSAPRPLLDVSLADLGSVLLPCLVDSGATNTLLPRWPAEVAGLDLGDAEKRELGVGGALVSVRLAVIRMSVAGLTWEAQVGFCDAWPYAWGLLGHESFFRWFTVTFRAADYEFELEPNSA